MKNRKPPDPVKPGVVNHGLFGNREKISKNYFQYDYISDNVTPSKI